MIMRVGKGFSLYPPYAHQTTPGIKFVKDLKLMTLDLIKLVLILLVIVIPVLLLQYRIDISRIRKSVQEKGWTKARVRPVEGERKSLNESNKRFYRVDYTDAEGKECFAICQASLLGGISWKE